MRFFINDQNITFGYPTYGKIEKSKYVNQLILMNVQNNFLLTLLYLNNISYLATEIFLEQQKWNFVFLKKPLIQ